MPFLLIIFFLILLPAMEVYLLFSWIGESPVIALLYLAASMFAGAVCLMLAKAGLRDLIAHLRARRDGGGARHILLLGKLWLIGALLLFPGYLTDIGALLLFFARRPAAVKGEIVEARGRLKDGE